MTITKPAVSETGALARNAAELRQQGFTVLRGFVDHAITTSVRDFIDRMMAAGVPGGEGTSRFQYRINHPCDDPLLAALAADERLAEVARQCLGCRGPADLRLRQQVFMKTVRAENPSPAPRGSHIDSPFLPKERDAAPRQTYIQFFLYCNDVAPGGAGVWVSPRSHTRAYEHFARLGRDEDREIYAPAWVAGLECEPLLEVTGGEGDLIVFDPMCIHSPSDNHTDQPRYVYHCSYFDASAPWIGRHRDKLCDPFPPSLCESLPAGMKSLVSTE